MINLFTSIDAYIYVCIKNEEAIKSTWWCQSICIISNSFYFWNPVLYVISSTLFSCPLIAIHAIEIKMDH